MFQLPIEGIWQVPGRAWIPPWPGYTSGRAGGLPLLLAL